MPLQIIPQQNQPVGLQLLGDQLLGGATDYANKRRQDELLARQRAEKLADVASERGYETQRFDKVRSLQLADEQRRRNEGLEDAKKRAEMERRLALLSEAEARGIFDARLIGNQVAEEAALQALTAQKLKEADFAREQPINAQTRLDQLVQDERKVTQQMAAVEAKLAEQPTVNQQTVLNNAIQIATQNNGGKTPSREQIQAAYAEALAKAQQEAQIRWYQDKQDASVQYQILSSQLNTIRQQQANLTSTFKVAPKTAALSMPPPAVVPTATTAPTGNPLAKFVEELNNRLPQNTPATVTDNTGPTVQNITSALSMAPASAAPVLRQARTSMLADQYAKLDAPVASTEAKLADVNQKLSRLQSGLNPMQGVNPQAIDLPPEATGEFMTNLLLQQQALQRQLQQQRTQRSTSKTGLLSGIPPAAPFAPATQSSMGELLSD